MRHSVKKITVTLSIIFIINFAGQFLYKRFDLTADKRFTLSQTTSNILSEIKEPLYVDVFLEGKFPGEFKKLQTETQQLLEELKAQNESIIFQFVNPLEDEECPFAQEVPNRLVQMQVDYSLTTLSFPTFEMIE